MPHHSGDGRRVTELGSSGHRCIHTNILKRGAEAILYQGTYLGRRVVVKKRVPKGYRNRVLDEMIRRERTVHEAKMLSLVKKTGIRAPVLYDVNLDECTIVMQYIDGVNLRNMFDTNVPEGLPFEIGRVVGTLHEHGIIHGDLTTSNMIQSSGLVLVDFGLSRQSSEIEDMGADFLLMEEALIGLHPHLSCTLKEIRRGYASRFSQAKKVFNKVSEIRKRRRYV